MDRACALLTLKAFDIERRTFAGVASTPTPDRAGDVFEPLGATFANPVPLLLFHDKSKPVGTATLSATKEGIAFEASIPEVAEAGIVRDRVDEAWHSIRSGLVKGLSIGFRVIDNGIERLKSGVRFTKTEICELSLVAVPANRDATILSIKSLVEAASGRTPSGVSDTPVVRAMNKQTLTEQIAAYEKNRQQKLDRRDAMMEQSTLSGATFTDEETKEYETLGKELDAIEAHLVRLREYEKRLLDEATRVVTTTIATKESSEIRGGNATIVHVPPVVPKGTAWLRMMQAKIACKGSISDAIAFAERWKDSTPEVILALKAAVAPATTSDPAWAGALVRPPTRLEQDFIEFLRPATLLGKIAGFKRVPFNCLVPIQTGKAAAKWVGQNEPKPLTKASFGSVALDQAKIAGIIVFTEELARNSSPAAEEVFRRELTAAIAEFMDSEFLDPAIAAVPGISPASITNGVTATTATGNAGVDLAALLGKFVTANIPLSSLTLIMSESNALALSMLKNPLGQPMYPGLALGGGAFYGVPVVTSQTANDWVVALASNYILFADDGGVTIDVSREASVEMTDTPTGTGTLRSLWQNNLIGLRAERYVTWKRALDGAVQYLTGANWMPSVPVTPPESPMMAAGAPHVTPTHEASTTRTHRST